MLCLGGGNPSGGVIAGGTVAPSGACVFAPNGWVTGTVAAGGGGSACGAAAKLCAGTDAVAAIGAGCVLGPGAVAVGS